MTRAVSRCDSDEGAAPFSAPSRCPEDARRCRRHHGGRLEVELAAVLDYEASAFDGTERVPSRVTTAPLAADLLGQALARVEWSGIAIAHAA